MEGRDGWEDLLYCCNRHSYCRKDGGVFGFVCVHISKLDSPKRLFTRSFLVPFFTTRISISFCVVVGVGRRFSVLASVVLDAVTLLVLEDFCSCLPQVCV